MPAERMSKSDSAGLAGAGIGGWREAGVVILVSESGRSGGVANELHYDNQAR